LTTARCFSSYPSDSTSRWTPCPPRSSSGPARHYSRLWIWLSPPESQRDFNPPDWCAAWRTLLAHPSSAKAATGPHGFGVASLWAPRQTSLVARRICPVHAATNTPAEPQDAFLVSSPATTAFPVVEAGRLPRLRFQGLLGVHYALQPARPADSLTEPFLGVLQPIRHLLVRPKCFRLGRASPVGILTRGFNVPSQGALNKSVAPL